jgi:hypothetical protein
VHAPSDAHEDTCVYALEGETTLPPSHASCMACLATAKIINKFKLVVTTT